MSTLDNYPINPLTDDEVRYVAKMYVDKYPNVTLAWLTMADFVRVGEHIGDEDIQDVEPCGRWVGVKAETMTNNKRVIRKVVKAREEKGLDMAGAMSMMSDMVKDITEQRG